MVKIFKFQGGRETKQADVFVHDKVVGWIDREMTSEWFGLQRKWSVEGYTVNLYDDEDDRTFKTMPEARAFLKTRFP